MDLFRYFHPHHNPRLRKVPLRLQELGELELASKELHRALQRAQIRTEASNGDPESYNNILEAVNFVIESLSQLVRTHAGDSAEAVEQLIEERKNIPGWENWSRIVKERLEESLLERRAAG